MADDGDVDLVIREMITRCRAAAPVIAREQAEITDGIPDPLSGDTGRHIADAIERVPPAVFGTPD
jgi:hypothetical protein